VRCAGYGKPAAGPFSHRKSVLTKSTWTDPPVRYPPYTKLKRKLIRKCF
jgi:aldehyde dehydrogenase (NAD+)